MREVNKATSSGPEDGCNFNHSAGAILKCSVCVVIASRVLAGEALIDVG